MRYYEMMEPGHDNWLMELFMYIIGIVFIALIVAIIVKLINNDKAAIKSSNSVKPLDIVKSRYARGEITKAEFDQIKSDLE